MNQRTATTLPSPRRCPARCVYCGAELHYALWQLFTPTCERHADLPRIEAAMRGERRQAVRRR